MFSGMFTHCVKPALTAQQAKELFALLGYQPAGSDEEELRLSAKPIQSHTLLQLACGFFTARLECQLLITAVTALGGSVEWVLQLLQERKRGCTFQIALDNTKRKLESAPCDSPSDLDATVDLYTDDSQAEQSHMASPPSLSYIPPSEDPLPLKISCSNSSQSSKDRNEKKAQTTSISSLTCQINAAPQKTNSSQTRCERQFTATCNTQLGASKGGQYVCNCLKSYDSYPYQCVQCEKIHSKDCPCFRSCIEQGHNIVNALSKISQDQARHLEKAPKDELKQHSCINKPSADFFFVCHNCHYIHDGKCEELQMCFHKGHIVQNTERLQPAQVERVVTAHTCLKVEDTKYAVTCYTCNKSHDLICNELQSCELASHNMSYVPENIEPATQAKPMPLHQCCRFTKPEFACLTCRVFHTVSCDDNQCQRHDVQNLRSKCCICSETTLYTLCRFCCAQLCKQCWFKEPLYCKCGMRFDDSSV